MTTSFKTFLTEARAKKKEVEKLKLKGNKSKITVHPEAAPKMTKVKKGSKAVNAGYSPKK